MKSEKVYLSLGSNLGDRESNLAQATIALSINFEIQNIISSSSPGTDITQLSTLSNTFNNVILSSDKYYQGSYYLHLLK